MNKELLTSFNILKQIYFNNAYANIELNNNKSNNFNFSLVTKIVYGVIDNNVKYDFYLSQFFKKAPKKQAVLLLKIACYVKFNINSIPHFALANELVNIAKKCELKPYSGFINAVIKNIIKTDFVLPDNIDTKTKLSINYSKPLWYIDFLINNYGLDTAEQIVKTELTNQTHIRINTNLISVGDFIDLLIKYKIDYTNSPLKDAVFVDYEKLLQHDLSSLYTPQGITSMLVARQVKGDQILDSCSAPGGKAVYAATLNPNSNVVACDIHSHRVELIKNYANRMNIKNVSAIQLDATKFNPEFSEKFDVVILDVPCSGLGVINKKPDILLKEKPNFDQIENLQYQILLNNANYVKPGGYIVYSTCTINKGENEMILNKFLANNKNFVEDTVDCCGLKAEGNNFKTFLPHLSNTEGFFIGRIKRND